MGSRNSQFKIQVEFDNKYFKITNFEINYEKPAI